MKSVISKKEIDSIFIINDEDFVVQFDINMLNTCICITIMST